MKMMHYMVMSLFLGAGIWQLDATELTVPESKTTYARNKFYDFYALNPYHHFKSIEINDEEPIFYILVHGTFSSASDSADPETLYWGENEFIEMIPKDFFGPNTNSVKNPIRFAFEWSGVDSDAARKNGGKELALAIRELYDAFPKAYVICLGHSHGGNVMNVASQYLDNEHAMDYAIQLATPVMCYNSKEHIFDNASGYYPNGQAIGTLMIFYSEQDFIQTAGARAVNFRRRYAPIVGIDLYNVRLRKIRGIDDLHVHMHDDVIGGKILQLCQKIKTTYINNKNLIADITPANRRKKSAAERKVSVTPAELNMPLFCIRPYSGGKKSTLTELFQGKATDSFWPDWTGKYPQEIAASNQDAQIFKNIFGFPMDERLSNADRAIQAVKEMTKEGKRRAARLFSKAAPDTSEKGKNSKKMLASNNN